jgi:hypothetical protein
LQIAHGSRDARAISENASMRRNTLAAAVILFGLLASAALSAAGCLSDPHDTHVRTNVSDAR